MVKVSYNYSFDKVNKDLEDLTKQLERWETENHNKKIGYNSKCKVCTSNHIDEIESLREEGHTLEEIKEYLDLDLSIMSLSRHFNKHYPKSQKYKLKQQIQLLENIQEAYIKYPYLENYFKNRPLEYLERFNNSDGFCLDGFCLCKMLEAGTVSNCKDHIQDIINKMATDIENIDSTYYFTSKTEKVTQIKLDGVLLQNYCLKCKEGINSDRLDLLEKLITYNFLNIPVDDKETYFNLLNYNGNKKDFINTLGDIKVENTPAK